ncbi:MAG: ABC transporter substrate-binding protein [Pseudomonadota bacterium]|nr:ABC transporter substrate-binding protein [Pseudomonadota bacterium]
MKHTFIAIALAASLLTAVPGVVLAQAATAATSKAASPSQIVLANSSRVLSTLEARRAEFSSNPAALEKFVSGEFNKMFDREYAGRLVLGRHGRGASDADVGLFADALSDNLMRRYGASLLEFNTELKVRVKSETPLRGGSIVKVSTEMLRQGGEPIPVDYLMRKVGNDWKAFDVMVEGVSFVQTFRNQFDTPLAQKSIAQVANDIKAGQIQVKTE